MMPTMATTISSSISEYPRHGSAGASRCRLRHPRGTRPRITLLSRRDDLVANLLQGLLADPLDVQEVLHALEGAVLLPVLDDPLRVGRTDSRQRGELVRAGGVHVDARDLILGR